MGIDFDQGRWDRVKENAAKWWRQELGRPLVQIRVRKRPTGAVPELPLFDFLSFYDLSVPAEQIIDRYDFELRNTIFLGDAFPHFWPNLGPGVIAATMGAALTNGENTVWFQARKSKQAQDCDLALNRQAVWFRRIHDLTRCALERWQGLVQIGMTDIGGNLDIVSTFRPGEQLLYDLIDAPQQVKRLLWQAHHAWWEFFNDFAQITKGRNPGFSCWTPLFSATPYYMLQCDFAYMIGPQMFREFVQPELQQSAARLDHAFYHLDGAGQLPHLDMLLDTEAIKGIQWVPGDGAAPVEAWPQVYRKITDAGKLIQLFQAQTNIPFEIVDELAQQTGRSDHIAYVMDIDESQLDRAETLLATVGCA